MEKRIFMVPVKGFKEVGLTGIEDLFIKRYVSLILKSQGVTSSNALVLAPPVVLESGTHAYATLRFAEKVAEYCKIKIMSVECVDDGQDMDTLFNQVRRYYFDTKTKVKNIIIPIDYEYITHHKWNNLLEIVNRGNLPQMGWIAKGVIDDSSRHLKFFSFADHVEYSLIAPDVLPVVDMVIPQWLNTQTYKGEDREWYEPLIFKLLHTPNIPENREVRKSIWKELRKRKGYVFGRSFPE